MVDRVRRSIRIIGVLARSASALVRVGSSSDKESNGRKLAVLPCFVVLLYSSSSSFSCSLVASQHVETVPKARD